MTRVISVLLNEQISNSQSDLTVINKSDLGPHLFHFSHFFAKWEDGKLPFRLLSKRSYTSHDMFRLGPLLIRMSEVDGLVRCHIRSRDFSLEARMLNALGGKLTTFVVRKRSGYLFLE